MREINGFDKNKFAKELSVFAYKQPRKGWLNEDNRKWVNSTIYLRRRFLHNLSALLYFSFSCPIKCAKLIALVLKELPNLTLLTCFKTIIHIFVGFGLAKEVLNRRIELLHAHFATASTLALCAHILTDVPFSFTAHASGDIYVYSAFLKEKIKRAHRIISISEYNKKYLQLISDHEIDRSKIIVIYNGVEIPSQTTKCESNNLPVLFMSAAFSGVKGHGTLINVLEKLSSRGVAFLCRLAGDGPYYGRIASMIKEKQLEEFVELLGSQPLSNVYENLKKSDIFVFPAETSINGLRDGMPTAITEAMAHGLPVVATAVSGIPEQVIDGFNGYLVYERDEKALADKLEVLLKDPKLRNQMGENGRALAAEKFDTKKTVRQVAKAISSAKKL